MSTVTKKKNYRRPRPLVPPVPKDVRRVDPEKDAAYECLVIGGAIHYKPVRICSPDDATDRQRLVG